MFLEVSFILQARRHREVGLRERGGEEGCPPNIFAKVDYLPTDNYSEKKKSAKKYRPAPKSNKKSNKFQMICSNQYFIRCLT